MSPIEPVLHSFGTYGITACAGDATGAVGFVVEVAAQARESEKAQGDNQPDERACDCATDAETKNDFVYFVF